jgi:hypothetical protein
VATVVVLILGTAIAIACKARPSFDSSGWLVWGRQTLQWNLNLDGAPSWKTLSFLFTLPYALFSRPIQMWLWIITALGGAVGAPLLAGRLAWRLSPRGEGWMPRRFPPLLAALIAVGAVATMTVSAKSTPVLMGYLRQALIVTADPLALAMWLLAMDCCLSRRYGWTLFFLWMAMLGRPEALPFLIGFAGWLWFRVPQFRIWAVLAVFSTPVAWFLAPGLASHSWLSGSSFDMGQATAIHGDKVLGVLNRLRTLTGTAIQIEVGAGIILCLLLRDRRTIAVTGVGFLWAVIEIAFALHGYSAVPRYMIEAGAPLAVAGGVGAAYAVTWPISRLGSRSRLRTPLSVAGLLAVVGFLVALEPFAHASVNAARGVIENQKLDTDELNGLTQLVDRAGGAPRILACGSPAGPLGWQSGLALQLNLDVGDVGFGDKRHFSTPVVYFSHEDSHWTMTVLNPPADETASCQALNGASD